MKVQRRCDHLLQSGVRVGLVLLVFLSVAFFGGADDFELVVVARDPPPQSAPPPPPEYPLQLMLDDDSSENDLGVVTSNGGGKQFLWLNQFSPATYPIELNQIWVLFPPGNNITVDSPVQIAVYQDPDGNPANGVSLVTDLNEVIQVVDGSTFSIYELDPPLLLNGPGDVLIGVVNRFVNSGVTSATQPAAIDSSSAQSRSWIAVWDNDPPDPPLLSTAGLFDLVDSFEPGNWMIRAFGTELQIQQQQAIPMLGRAALVALALLIAIAGMFLIRR